MTVDATGRRGRRWRSRARRRRDAAAALGACALVALLGAGCTDWGEGALDAPTIGVAAGAAAAAGVGNNAVVDVDGWRAPAVDASGAPDAGADVMWDVAIVDAALGHGGAGRGGRSSSDVGVGVDVGADEDAGGGGDGGGAVVDAGGVDVSGGDGAAGDVGSGIDVGGSGGDGVVVDAGAADAGVGDAGGAVDAGGGDAGVGDVDGVDVVASDAGGGVDSGVGDVGVGDAGVGDVGVADVGVGDASVGDVGVGDAGASDVAVGDVGEGDVGVSDVGVSDVGVSDAGVGDVGVVDAGVVDAGAQDAASWPDAGWTPDWAGYPDASWPSDADVYGGVITSCFNAYAYVFQEACTGDKLTTACVDGAAQDSSLYTQFLFQPLRECANSLCVPGCAGKGEGSFQCVEACLGKQCAFPLFACLAQGEAGTNDCPTTFACLNDYPDKIFSIATKCFANATVPAQQQLASFFGCGQQPQTDSCFDHIAACYGSGSATCLQTIQCSDGCPKGDESCAFACIGKASPKAQQQLDALWDCINAKCGDCASPNGCGESCHNQQCNTEQLACVLGN